MTAPAVVRRPRLPTRKRSRRVSVEPPASEAGRRITDDPSVLDLDAALHGGAHFEVVGDDQNRRALLVQFAEQFEDGRASRRIQIPGGLVGHDQGRPAREGPGDGSALPLPARQLVRAGPIR